MQIRVTDRISIEAGIDCNTSYIVISIHDGGAPPAKVKKQAGLRAVLPIAIDDTEPTIRFRASDSVLMSEAHANAIWDFVDEHQSEVETLIVHCNAGCSRSPAVAAAICKVLGGNGRRFFRGKEPNMHVYRLMVRVGKERRAG